MGTLTYKWAEIKIKLDAGFEFRWIISENNYNIFCADGPFTYLCIVPISSPANADQEDFEANYKLLAIRPGLTRNVAVQGQTPFAEPTYRTKRDGLGWTTCAANATTDLDYQLTAERYVSGGELLFKNIKEGDYVIAEVYDKDSVIPEGYRAATCEAWPSVAKYVIKQYLMPCTEYGHLIIDAYPLNAKITAGLYLRVSLVTTNEAGDRKTAINYYLTKKL